MDRFINNKINYFSIFLIVSISFNHRYLFHLKLHFIKYSITQIKYNILFIYFCIIYFLM